MEVVQRLGQFYGVYFHTYGDAKASFISHQFGEDGEERRREGNFSFVLGLSGAPVRAPHLYCTTVEMKVENRILLDIEGKRDWAGSDRPLRFM